MEQQAVDLGFVLKQFPDFKLSMDSFDGRLRLQKFVYLLQTFDVYLGYDFSWYIRGPYCSTLATCGFGLVGMYNKIPDGEKVKFVDSSVQDRFERFAEFISGKEHDTDYLEIAASLHCLKALGKYTDDQILERVKNKRNSFTEQQCKDIWEDLKKWRLVQAEN